MAIQGRLLTETETRRIITLLTATDMTLPEIALRMGCSRSTVAAINRHYGVRDYRGQRATWTLATRQPELMNIEKAG